MDGAACFIDSFSGRTRLSCHTIKPLLQISGNHFKTFQDASRARRGLSYDSVSGRMYELVRHKESEIRFRHAYIAIEVKHKQLFPKRIQNISTCFTVNFQKKFLAKLGA